MEENRVETAMKNWLTQEQRLKEMFGQDIVSQPHFEKVRLEVFREIYNEAKPTASSAEKSMLILLKGEVDRIEKALYPNVILRFFRAMGRGIGVSAGKKIEDGRSFKLNIQEKAFDKTSNNNSSEYRANRAQKLKGKQVILLPKKRIRKSKGLGVK